MTGLEPREAAQYDAGYHDGWSACLDVDLAKRTQSPPGHHTEDLSASRRRGYCDGWSAAALWGEA